MENNPSKCFKSGGELNGDSLGTGQKSFKVSKCYVKNGDSYDPNSNRYSLKNDISAQNHAILFLIS